MINKILQYLDHVIKINKRSILITLFIYKISLDFVYVYFVNPTYEGMLMTYDFALYKYILSLLAMGSILKYLLKCYYSETCSSKICLLLNWLYFIPMCTLYAFAGLPDMFFLFFFVSWFLFMFFQNNLKSFMIPIMKNRNTKNFFYLFSIGTLVFSAFISLYYNGFNFQLSLIDVYENRAEAKMINMPLILHYVKGLAGVFFPVLTLYALINKEKLFFILIILVAYLNFSFGAAKTDAFAVILAIIVYFFYKSNRLNWLPNIYAAFNIMVGLRILSVMAGAIFVHRLLFIPSQLSFLFYDFFSSQELLFLRESLLKRIGIPSPYETSIVYIISDVYFNAPEMCANQGLIGDAFANFGWYSLFFYPFLWALVGKVADGFVKGIDSKIIIIVAYSIALPIISGTFFSIFFSNGIFLLLCLLYLMPRNKAKNQLIL